MKITGRMFKCRLLQKRGSCDNRQNPERVSVAAECGTGRPEESTVTLGYKEIMADYWLAWKPLDTSFSCRARMKQCAKSANAQGYSAGK